MGFSCLDAQIQRDGNLLAGPAFGKQLNHFALPRSQKVAGRVDVILTLFTVAIKKAVQHHLADARGKESTLKLDSLNGGNKIATSIGLQQETASTGSEHVP